MSELDNLRPEVREAVVAIDGGNGVFVNSDDGIGSAKWKVVRAELLRLAGECATLSKLLDSARMDRIDEFRHANKAEAELEAAQNTINAQQDTMGALKRKLAIAEAELEALKARIADSPIASLVYGQGNLIAVISAENPDDWAGKRVRLVEVE